MRDLLFSEYNSIFKVFLFSVLLYQYRTTYYPFVHRRDRAEKKDSALYPRSAADSTQLLASLFSELSLSHSVIPGTAWGMTEPFPPFVTIVLNRKCKKEPRGQGPPGKKTLLPGTPLKLEGHRLEDKVTLLSELKENPVWLFVTLHEL